jgi:hypothetical protein
MKVAVSFDGVKRLAVLADPIDGSIGAHFI